MKLDHVIIGVKDLDAATETYEAILGVPVAARSEHPKYGTHNALFVFERGPYLELLAPRPGADARGFAAGLPRFLAQRGEGLFGLALTPAEMGAAIARLRGLGFDVADAEHGTGVGPDGRVREWRNTPLPEDAWPGAFSILIQHEGWDWRRELQPAPRPQRVGSAVRAIHHIVFDVASTDGTSAAWQQRFGLRRSEQIRSERMGALVNIHPAGEATIECVSATTEDGPVAQRIARRGLGMSSIAFEVRDLAEAVQAVRDAGLTIGDPAPGVLSESDVARLEPASACGVAAQLVQFG